MAKRLVENWIKFKDGNSVVFFNEAKENHFFLPPGVYLTFDNLRMPENWKIVYRELKITYPTWLKKIKEVMPSERP